LLFLNSINLNFNNPLLLIIDKFNFLIMKQTIFISTILFLFFLSANGQDRASLSADAKKAQDNKNYKAAIDLYSKAIAIEPTGFDLWGRAYCYGQTDDIKKAIDDYLSAISFYQTDKTSLAILYENIGLNYGRLKEYNTCVDYYNKALEANPDRKTVYWNRAIAYYNLDETEKAIADDDKAIKLYQGDNESLITLYENRGVHKNYNGDYKGAIEDYTSCLALKPDNGSAYWNRAVSYANLKEFGKALDDNTKAISMYQDDTRSLSTLYNNRGTYQRYSNDNNSAIESYNRSIQYRNDYALAFWNRARAYANQKKYPKAIEDLSSAITFYGKDSSNVASVYCSMAEYNGRLNKISEAKECYAKAIQYNPTQYNYAERAAFLIKKGDYRGAVADYTSSINIATAKKQSAVYYYYKRGKVYRFNLNEPTLASADFQKVIELDKNNSVFVPFSKAFTGDVEQAFSMMEARIAKATEKKNEYFNMACLHSLLGNESEAIRYLDLTFQNGYNDYESFQENSDFNSIKYKPAFKNLIAKYSIPYDLTINSISEVIKGEVKVALAKWQEKGEFETSQQYIERMNQRDAMVSSLTEKSLDKFKKQHMADANLNSFTLAKYDAESQTFKISYNSTGDVAIVKVPLPEAPAFKENQSKLKFSKANYIIQNDAWVLSYVEITNPITAKVYKYDITKQENYDPTTKFVLNYEDVKIDIPNQNVVNSSGIAGSGKTIVLGRPEVDSNIPVTTAQKLNTYCLIIGNEDYSSYQTNLSTEVNVDFAANDAKIFKEYCVKTLGIPEKQIKLLVNATAGQMSQGIAWLTNLAKIDEGNAELIFYYSGHGLPDEQTKEAYLIPVDISGANVTQGIKVNEVYKRLNEFPSKKITVFLDACFSGGARNQGLIAMKGVKVRPKENLVTGNMVVFSSSTGEESSGVYREMQHGYMTYFLLKKLQETKGDISYKDFANYIINNVKKETALNGKIQTPQLNFSPSVEETWTNWILK